LKLPTMKPIAKPCSIGQRNGVARSRKGVDSGIDPPFFRILGRRAKLATALEGLPTVAGPLALRNAGNVFQGCPVVQQETELHAMYQLQVVH
jgi:hypothetical protein